MPITPNQAQVGTKVKIPTQKTVGLSLETCLQEETLTAPFLIISNSTEEEFGPDTVALQFPSGDRMGFHLQDLDLYL